MFTGKTHKPHSNMYRVYQAHLLHTVQSYTSPFSPALDWGTSLHRPGRLLCHRNQASHWTMPSNVLSIIFFLWNLTTEPKSYMRQIPSSLVRTHAGAARTQLYSTDHHSRIGAVLQLHLLLSLRCLTAAYACSTLRHWQSISTRKTSLDLAFMERIR